ncbi:hypothetical protein [Luteimonas sp. FCS-9]|uniref:hypothetical protein n=1 Tax=Luteimonas sp. FCS-9 TaxID=1547516 RepID=UPI00063EAC67|nr:hypothetical protein [Luteimonas sp. FCS-9]KLJ02848.1 hypothetical protein WQ56_00780 [Luteimonas sp. FCS-9]
MTTHTLDPKITAKWENGEYGRSDEHVVVASEALHNQLDEALAMKLVSIRLPIPLIDSLKAIASFHEIAYQPMIRDLLTRFARSEVQQIVSELDAKMRAAQRTDESSPPVDSFMERTRAAACG